MRFNCGRFLLLTVMAVLAACSGSQQPLMPAAPDLEYDLLFSLPARRIDYHSEVEPILAKRCVVCHGCYDAPCQLKLSSPAGIARGASKEKVYDGSRILPAEPSRLFIDAQTTAQWRQKDFYPVLNEGFDNPRRNLEQSVMYRLLYLKQRHPLARTGRLPAGFDLRLDREQSCPTIDEADDYAREHPLGGMPYALPGLERKAYTTLVHWLAQGATMPDPPQPSAAAAAQIRRWEAMLNGASNKEKLIARYLYEHLFQAHLHFAGTGEREFYRLVRSHTPPGQQPVIIASRRPYGDPQGRVYYRLLRIPGVIVAKNHTVYELSDKRMARLRELFYAPDYKVGRLPSYAPEVASNPIRAFATLPLKSRYRFLLDDARFFIEGFIKGPVCRGQIALNVIEDRFWVVFFDPDAKIASLDGERLRQTANYLASPTELEDNFNLLASRLYYQQLFKRYITSKQMQMHDFKPLSLDEAMDFIWDGDGGTNPNAALTVFRHFDSASVHEGFVGDFPETAWVLDYSVLERIHYLLVAGYDVYGNIGHQLNTRLYMDFLRTEGEDFFLSFLPARDRLRIRNSWYQGIRQGDNDTEGLEPWLNKDFVTGYHSDDPQRELYRHLIQRLGKLAGNDVINRCPGGCIDDAQNRRAHANFMMQKAAAMHGKVMQILPDLAFVRVTLGGRPQDDLAYTFISDKAYKSVRSMFSDEKGADRRDYLDDRQTVAPWLEGAYPNFFYSVPYEKLEAFIDEYNAIETPLQYEIFVARYGIRRTDPRFWEMADWFNDAYRRQQPVLSGLFDLNRYEDR